MMKSMLIIEREYSNLFDEFQFRWDNHLIMTNVQWKHRRSNEFEWRWNNRWFSMNWICFFEDSWIISISIRLFLMEFDQSIEVLNKVLRLITTNDRHREFQINNPINNLQYTFSITKIFVEKHFFHWINI